MPASIRREAVRAVRPALQELELQSEVVEGAPQRPREQGARAALQGAAASLQEEEEALQEEEAHPEGEAVRQGEEEALGCRGDQPP